MAAIALPTISTPIVIGELQTVSYSIHREVVPVRALGKINPVGFCLPESAKVLVKNRGYISIKDIREGDLIESYPNKYDSVTMHSYQGKKKCYKVSIDDGYEIEASYDHPIMTSGGWKETEELTTEDLIAVSAKDPANDEDMNIEDDVLKMIGYLIWNGSMYTYQDADDNVGYEISLLISNDSINRTTKDILNRLGIWFEDCKKDEYIYRRISPYETESTYNKLHYALLDYDMYETNDSIHNELIDKLSPRQISILLNAIFSSNGGFDKENSLMRCCTTFKTLAEQIRILLNKIGIQSALNEPKRDCYIIDINSVDNLLKFITKVGISLEADELEEVKSSLYINSRDDLVQQDFVWKKVIAKEDIGDKDVYDISVSNTQSFIANHIYVHNTAGQRTIAGSLIFTVFDKNIVYDILEKALEINNMGLTNINLKKQSILMDEMPPFDIVITMANEYGQKSGLIIKGVVIVDEGQVMSIEDMITENTMSYMASDIQVLNKITNSKLPL